MVWPEIFYAHKCWNSFSCHLDVRVEGRSSVHLHTRADLQGKDDKVRFKRLGYITCDKLFYLFYVGLVAS